MQLVLAPGLPTRASVNCCDDPSPSLRPPHARVALRRPASEDPALDQHREVGAARAARAAERVHALPQGRRAQRARGRLCRSVRRGVGGGRRGGRICGVGDRRQYLSSHLSRGRDPSNKRVFCAQFLWWATRLTFNSFRIYRHMFRLLSASGDPELAKRTLRLYIQVVSKVREAGSFQGGTMADAEGALEWDTDRLWVQTLVLGAKMFCRLAVQETDQGKAVELAKEAGTIIEKAKLRLDEDDKELVASTQLAEGIWLSAMVHAGT